MNKTIDVVAAILENDNKEILCALRSTQMALPNLWEFPGGKLNPGETEQAALARELKEELLCDVEVLDHFDRITHRYPTFTINLSTYRCRILTGIPTATEHAKLVWLKRENLFSLKWAPADIPTLERLVAEIDQSVSSS